MLKNKIPALLLFCCYGCFAVAQPKTDSLLKRLLKSNPSAILQQVLQHPETYRPQIIYTQINRDKHNTPSFTNYYYNVDSLLYFNPASTVKLPLALLSLEKLNEMHVPGVNKFTSIQFDSGYNTLRAEYRDSTAETGVPSIAQFIRKAFLVSDNDAYNRMYEFVGQQTINRKLHEKGYADARISRHFWRMNVDQNRHTSAIHFIDKNGRIIYTQPPAYNTDSFDFSHINKIGIGYMDSNDSLVHAPMDFTEHNNISLHDYQQILQSVMFPQSVPAKQRFNLTKDDYAFLHQYLSQYPRETNYPKYDSATYYDSYVKFFFSDSAHTTMPAQVRVFNKVGWAYGFLTDISYVVDFEHNIEYMLTATVYANSDGILNDDTYDFETVAHPFMYQVGQTIYQYELQRKREYTPDLSAFKIKYEKRVPDNRPLIKNVDN
ncbi:MAG TPA: serine hydrolase [Chitinophagaceae bacterium]|nr:serine hydrolase [Chitinophagaceae bacterium]